MPASTRPPATTSRSSTTTTLSMPDHVSRARRAAAATAPRVVHSLCARHLPRWHGGDVGQSRRAHAALRAQLHPSVRGARAALARRRTAAASIRSSTILEDWDFFLALAQRTRFHSCRAPRSCGTPSRRLGRGRRRQPGRRALRAVSRPACTRSGAPRAMRWSTRVQPMLQAAAAAAQAATSRRRGARAREVLAISQNDPWALNLLAMIERAAGDLARRARTQELAVAVRPGDADLVYNLALLCRDGRRPRRPRAHMRRTRASLAPQASPSTAPCAESNRPPGPPDPCRRPSPATRSTPSRAASPPSSTRAPPASSRPRASTRTASARSTRDATASSARSPRT